MKAIQNGRDFRLRHYLENLAIKIIYDRENMMAITEEVLEWPNDGGVWMAWIPGTKEEPGSWFPLKTIEIKGDLPEREDFGKTLAIMAQFPRSKTEWPYLFKGNHPWTRWRKPSEEELQKIDHFYGKK